jgi:hypothetical protein
VVLLVFVWYTVGLLAEDAVFVVFLFVILLSPFRADAYIDPGMGGLIFDALATVALGVGVFWKRIVSLFRALSGKKVPPK